MSPVSVPQRPTAPRLSLLQEQRYRRRFLREDGRQNAVVMTVVVAAYVLGLGSDLLLLRGGALLGVSLASRALLVVATAVALVLGRRARWPRQQDRASMLAQLGIVTVVLGTHLTRIPSGRTLGVLISSGALLAAIYFAQRGPICPRAVVGGTIAVTAAILLFAPRAAIEPSVRLTAVLSLLGLNVLGILSARAFQENRRKRFEAERHERQVRQELTVRLRELALERDRAEAMSRARAAFLAAMSHEFRTPMNAVIGLSDLLLDAPLAPDHRAHVRTISDSARALLGLLEDILDFAKIDAQKLTLSPAPFDLPGLATSVASMLRPAACARSVALSVDVAAEVPTHLLGDDPRLRQVLVNLVSNAVKFTERGAVTLCVTARPLGGGHHEIVFRLEDTGIGMAPGVLERVFRPFEQADAGSARRHGGTGLGLAISKQIVAAMGGDLQVESEPGRGSVFSFTLRLAATAPPERASAEPPAPPRADGPPLAILVVDDHVINREVAEALARGDTAELAREAHPLRSASASLGAVEMSDACGHLERAARAGRIDDLGAGLDALTAQLVEVERSLAREVEGWPLHAAREAP
jgi:signal transduction histidine kinase